MDRRKFIAGTGLAGILATGTAPAVHAQGATIRWRLASSFPKSLETLFGGSEIFAAKVKELSGGKFTISTHAAGELVPAFGVLDAVQQETVECAHTAAYYFFGKDETFAFDCAIPFGLNCRQQNAWMFDGNGLKLTREFYANYNVVNFPLGNSGAQMGGWFRKEIKGLEDLKGLKFRVGGFGGKILEQLGVVPQNLPGGEIYQSLEKGTIDAAEWIGPYDDLKLGLYKVAKNYYYPAFWEGGAQLSLYVNNKAYQSLSNEYKAILDTAANYAHTQVMARYDARNPSALRELVANGVRLHRLPKPVMDAAFKVSQDYYAELSNKNPRWKKIYADFSNFRRDQNLWFRFSEMSFDNFMQSQKL